MKNFQQIASNIDVTPLLHAIQRKPNLWNVENIRTRYPQSPHHQAEDIILRFNDIPEDISQVVNDKDCFNYPALQELPQARVIIHDLVRRVEGEQLGRVLITKLAPGKSITPHRDEGAPAEFYERYHVMLQNTPGSVFHCGGESVFMRSGDCWWFNNCKEHSVVNNGSDDRITLIVDIRAC